MTERGKGRSLFPFLTQPTSIAIMFPELTMHCHPRWLWKFNPLLQKGVKIRCRTNRSLMALLRDDCHLDDDYIRQRIQTITLNGRPVDDPANVMVPDGVTLAISGAMPGLVGATLRKGGYYAAMRSTISHKGGSTKATTEEGLVTVKLFNLILKDQAAAFLSRGIGVAGKTLVPLLDDLMAMPADEFGPVTLDDEQLQWPAWRNACRKEPLVFVLVH